MGTVLYSTLLPKDNRILKRKLWLNSSALCPGDILQLNHRQVHRLDTFAREASWSSDVSDFSHTTIQKYF